MKAADEQMEKFVEALKDMSDVPIQTKVLTGIASQAICDHAADRKLDLVIMPTHGRTGISRFFLGSVTEKVVRMCQKPVLTIRTPS